MKIQHLRFFAAVVDCGGVVKAAERLRVSQPAVSASLKALEIELGHPLFERSDSGRRQRPTDRAMRFHRDVLDILRQCDEARAKFRAEQAKPARLVLGVLQTIAASEVAACAAAFARLAPDLRLQLWEAGPLRLAEWLRQGRIDAAWTSVDMSADHARVLWREPFVVLAAHGHRFARDQHPDVALADLDGESIVLRTRCEMQRGRLWPERVRMRIAARAERDDLAVRLVAQGIGIAIAPRSLASDEVVARPVRDLDAIRSIGLKWRPDLAPETRDIALDAVSSVKRAGQRA
ncbi:MAG: LysR family transcriptional regulator [Rhizobiales bacterium]|nr:LysR family transcriptional regulator [Hyphomicrobiales bacterium]